MDLLPWFWFSDFVVCLFLPLHVVITFMTSDCFLSSFVLGFESSTMLKVRKFQKNILIIITYNATKLREFDIKILMIKWIRFPGSTDQYKQSHFAAVGIHWFGIKAQETNPQRLVNFVANFQGKDKNAGKAVFFIWN